MLTRCIKRIHSTYLISQFKLAVGGDSKRSIHIKLLSSTYQIGVSDTSMCRVSSEGVVRDALKVMCAVADESLTEAKKKHLKECTIHLQVHELDEVIRD